MSTLIAKDTTYNAIQDIQEENKKLKIRLNRKINGQKQQAYLKNLIGDKIYYKLLLLGGIILDRDGRVVKFGIWDENGEGYCMLYKYELKKLSFMIKDLRSLPNLKYINLECTNIKGNIYDLKSLPKLTGINLSCTDVTGNIERLKTLPNLTQISLYCTNVRGKIEHLKTLPNLTQIRLQFTGVTGDKEAFEASRDWEACYL